MNHLLKSGTTGKSAFGIKAVLVVVVSLAMMIPAVSNAANISTVPFAPVIEGDWSNKGNTWVNWAETTLKKEFDRFVDIESVRTKRIPFYSTSSRNVVLAEAIQAGRTGAYYIIAVTGENTTVVLNGNGDPIHEMNKLMAFSIDSPKKAEEYLKFFTSAISSEDGIFVVIDPRANYLPQSVYRIGIRPVRVRRKNSRKWLVSSDVIYGKSIFEAEFVIDRDGTVEMTADSFKEHLFLDYRVVMDGPRRMYIINS